MISGSLQTPISVRVDSKGLRGGFFVRVSFKGLSKFASDSKGVICCKLGQFGAFHVRVGSKGLSGRTGVRRQELGPEQNAEERGALKEWDDRAANFMRNITIKVHWLSRALWHCVVVR